MRTFRLLRRCRLIATYSEPTGLLHVNDAGFFDHDHDRGADASVDGESHVPTVCGTEEDLRGANAVFGLIGAPTTDGDGRAQRTHDHDDRPMTGAHDVIQILHEQYCRALDDPQASLAGNWAIPVEGESSMDMQEDHPLRREPSAGRESTDGGSIEALLSGARVLSDVFGSLGEGGMPGLAGLAGLADTEPIPEILRLFAPAEYHAAVSRRPATLPPALARREHHTLGIDSPMPAPDTTARHDIL